jgi:hypothetical protein
MALYNYNYIVLAVYEAHGLCYQRQFIVFIQYLTIMTGATGGCDTPAGYAYYSCAPERTPT